MKIDSVPWRQTVIAGAGMLGLELSEGQARRMGIHALELIQWNQVTNLTAITDPLEMALKHYVDALAAAAWIGNGARVLDAGSGGGFPGIPLAIGRPDLSVTLVDSARKKVSFLKHAIRRLELVDIDAVHGRLEALCRLPRYRETFDVVVCRAFSSLEDFATLTADFLTPGGCLLALRGRETNLHQPVVKQSEGRLLSLDRVVFEINIHRYRLPILDAVRNVVRLKRLADE